MITGGSAFNIKAKSLRLGDLYRAEVMTRYDQHSAETGQIFEPDALERLWDLSPGQPWLVNALGYEVCFENREARERTRPITRAMVETAKEDLILRQETHLDQLVDKLQEERVHRVMAPLLASESAEDQLRPDDIQYLLDLGLIRRGPAGGIDLANPIYREVVPRELAWIIQSGGKRGKRGKRKREKEREKGLKRGHGKAAEKGSGSRKRGPRKRGQCVRARSQFPAGENPAPARQASHR